jgi:hypothetical protein
VILNEVQIQKLLKKPANSASLEEARKNEHELREFAVKKKQKLVFADVEKILVSAKYEKFQVVHKNWTKALINKVETHYSRIFDAFGRVFDFNFGTNIADHVAFKELRTTTLFEGQGDETYFRNFAHKKAIQEPNSVFLTGFNDNMEIQVKHIKLSRIFDIEASPSKIEYLIIVQQMKLEDGTKFKRFFVYDDIQVSIWDETNDGHVAVPIGEVIQMPDGSFQQEIFALHGNNQVPAVFAYDENMGSDDDGEAENFIIKKSILSDSIPQLYAYSILKTFYLNYKHFGAFGKSFRTETRCNFVDESANVKCSSGKLVPLNAQKAHKPIGGSYDCPACNGGQKNQEAMGEVIEIPINQQGNPDLVANFTKLNFRIDADKGILEFHTQDVEKMKNGILADIIGDGFGESYKQQAINADQVRMNFDDQESNLNHYKHKIEKVWNMSETFAAELFSESFIDLTVSLGTRFFLKTNDQLYSELKLINETSSDQAAVDMKNMEIFLTEYRNNKNLIERQRVLKVLKPFSWLPIDYVTNNRAELQTNQMGSVQMYDNFGQVLAAYEFAFGPIENAFLNANFQSPAAKMAQLSKINDKFKEILNEILLSNEGQRPEPGPEGE